MSGLGTNFCLVLCVGVVECSRGSGKVGMGVERLGLWFRCRGECRYLLLLQDMSCFFILFCFVFVLLVATKVGNKMCLYLCLCLCYAT